MNKLSFVVFFCLGTSGCAYFGSTLGEKVYMSEHNGPGLIVPPPLTAQCLSSFFVLPPQEENPQVCILPPIEQDELAT